MPPTSALSAFTPSILAAVAAGGAIGSVARHLVGEFARRVPLLGGYPWGTLSVNALGSLAIGALAGLLVPLGGTTDAAAALPTPQWLHSAPTRAFLMIGLLGGFTTFSTFALEGLTMFQAGQPWRAVGYAVASVTLALAAAALGYTLARG